MSTALKRLGDYQRCMADVRSYRFDDTWGKAINFAIDLLRSLHNKSARPPPDTRSIVGGVFLSWPLGANRLYFEVDDESVMAVADGDDQAVAEYVDPSYSVERAVQFVKAQLHD